MSRLVLAHRRPHLIFQGYWIPPLLNPFRWLGVGVGCMVLTCPLLLIPVVGGWLAAIAASALALLTMCWWTAEEMKMRGWSIAVSTDERPDSIPARIPPGRVYVRTAPPA
jgi:hypothetical protein